MPKTDNPTSINDYEDIHKVDYPEGVLGVTDEEPLDIDIKDTTKY
jgi:hypothetical protein